VGNYTGGNPAPTDGCLIAVDLDDTYDADDDGDDTYGKRSNAVSPVMDLSACSDPADGVKLTWDMWFANNGDADDFLWLLVSNDGGDTWYRMAVFDDPAATWTPTTPYEQDVTNYATTDTFMVRFLFNADGDSNEDRGPYIDNINLVHYTENVTPATGATDLDIDVDTDVDDDDDCGTTLTVIYRDFSDDHDDFEMSGLDYRVCTGIVENALGGNGNPVLNEDSTCAVDFTSNDPDIFNEWYTDDTHRIPSEITLEDPDEDGTSTFADSTFFPIDGLGYGNEGRNHNFHFTTEINTYFIYETGQIFSFTGDDDVWVFIDGSLAVDVGGVHGEATRSVDLDTLGLTPGYIYSLDVFHAERHTVESNFRIDTNLCLQNVD
jgi:fibro-slime domain-containing protein